MNEEQCSCFPGVCRGGQVVDGKTASGHQCKVATQPAVIERTHRVGDVSVTEKFAQPTVNLNAEFGSLNKTEGDTIPTADFPRVFAEVSAKRKHSHYFKDVSHLTEIDVYRILMLFNITDQAIGHALKKLLVAGGRGGGKDISRDIQEAIDTLQRWQEIRQEDAAASNT